MSVTKSSFAQYVRNFELRELFNDMGWNNDRIRQPIVIKDATYLLTGLADKSGFRIFACVPADGTPPPDKENRKKIERAVTKLFQEHLIIYYDDSRSSQIWQLAVRKAGTPAKISETKYLLTQDPELLYQRASGLFFALDEEDKITIVDVTKRVSDNFQKNNEVVTKKFYEGFKKEHTAFLKFIDGIGDKVSQDWYASLMLNRLMFCYFIQKQRFLDNNENYLQDKLKECKQKKGKNKFYSFYRDFLLALFHKGLGAPKHGKDIEIELGNIPYLNGGLFDVHELEKTFTDINIDDKAFQRLFSFFDEWNWHLDTREAASGKDINPDVIGYIFEKYINDRAQMGAYYTKEDITDYISKNCIIPWLFDEVKRNYPKAFEGDGWLWRMVKDSGTDYIYDAVKHGMPETGELFDDFPPEVQKGFVPELGDKVVDGKGPFLWELRKDWNKQAPAHVALPTEIYREVIERRKRCAVLKLKIGAGEIQQINDFITHNLNIRQFVQDVVETTEDSDFLRHFYKALSSVTILDPTCGAGAFLFAAMNILEPLYETCIERMQEFVTEGAKGKYKFFEDTLKLVNAPEHPNLQYFIYKSIILNNLYGVDIMNEAVEIAKLRLFLKLMATVEADYRKPNIGLEPLPDVDFNIRAGNSLVGYATKEQIDNIAGMFVTQQHRKVILEQCDIVARAFERYKGIQLAGGDDYKEFKIAKENLISRLSKLTVDLDKILYLDQYHGIEKDEKAFVNWRSSSKPFHWFAEFYESIQTRQGFDVVIGNPPYVEYRKVTDTYKLSDSVYSTLSCGNLLAFVTERAHHISSANGKHGFVLLVSTFTTERMFPLQYLIQKQNAYAWISNFAWRPSRLFNGASTINALYIGTKSMAANTSAILATKYNKWNADERDNLFDLLEYGDCTKKVIQGSFPKISNQCNMSIGNKVTSGCPGISHTFIGKNRKNRFYYFRGMLYWIKALDFLPIQREDGVDKVSGQCKEVIVCDDVPATAIVAALSSSLFFWFYQTYSDCQQINKREFEGFRFDAKNTSVISKLSELGRVLMADYKKNANVVCRQNRKRNVLIEKHYFTINLSKPIIDNIDSILAAKYGLTHAELDFIINYDIKYRMGKELDNEGED